MSDNQRLEELRRRVAKDPASIAFAHLAEEYRRCGQYEEAVETCRTGLAFHPTYLSARVTLGRALMELGRFDDALAVLNLVLETAPENLAAIRTMSELQRRRGDDSTREMSPATLAAAKDHEELEKMVRRMSQSLDAPAAEARASDHDPTASAHDRRRPLHKPPDTDHELFALFGAALNGEAGRFRDMAREEFFAAAPSDSKPVSVTAPTAPPRSQYPTLELRPSKPAPAFDERELANLSFRQMPVEETVGFPPPVVSREAEEARKLLNALETWLGALQARPSASLGAP